MRTRPLGPGIPAVSVIGFGGMHLSIVGRPAEQSKALRTWGGRRDTVVVATKGGITRPGGRWERSGRPEQLRKACERSLKALRLDHIDLYQLHTPDPNVPFAESVGALVELQRAGKIRWIGVSNVSV